MFGFPLPGPFLVISEVNRLGQSHATPLRNLQGNVATLHDGLGRDDSRMTDDPAALIAELNRYREGEMDNRPVGASSIGDFGCTATQQCPTAE